MSKRYIERPITQYEFEKRQDRKAQKAEDEKPRQFICPVCKNYSDQEVLTFTFTIGQSELTKPREDGKPIRDNPFTRPCLVTCPDCHRNLTNLERQAYDPI